MSILYLLGIKCVASYCAPNQHAALCTLYPGGFQAHLLYVQEGWTAESVEGKLCHHGEGHALRCHTVLLPRTV